MRHLLLGASLLGAAGFTAGTANAQVTGSVSPNFDTPKICSFNGPPDEKRLVDAMKDCGRGDILVFSTNDEQTVAQVAPRVCDFTGAILITKIGFSCRYYGQLRTAVANSK